MPVQASVRETLFIQGHSIGARREQHADIDRHEAPDYGAARPSSQCDA
jgi:hypothetical protein